MIFRSRRTGAQVGMPAAMWRGLGPNRYDVAAAILLLAILIAIAHGARDFAQPLSALEATPISLSPWVLPEYALQSTLRMFAAILVSLLFTFTVATLAAKSRRAGQIIIPTLDILQSVPVLGFLTFTVVFFMGLFPGGRLGAELAAIFAIFTSQAWNMAFSFYQSLKTVPGELDEAARHFRLSPWMRFWRLEAPFAAPGLIWNTMMSMSGGWFFVVASEAITVGKTEVRLPGIGSYLALAIEEKNLLAVGQAIVAMAVVILIYDQIVFRPIVAWADKFRAEQTAGVLAPRSWVLDILRRTRALRTAGTLWRETADQIERAIARLAPAIHGTRTGDSSARFETIWNGLIFAAVGWGLWTIASYIHAHLGFADLGAVLLGGLATLIRVVVLIALASLIWVPVGVWVGLRPGIADRIQPLAQFLAAFPANVMFPIFVMAIAAFRLDPNIWLSPLMILGAQWYILFNVIAGASAFPNDLRDATTLMGARGWQWWRSVILPGIFPYYVTGALTATGGAWNASIVAEVVSWGETRLSAMGLGAYIAHATEAGDMPRVVLGIAAMSGFVVLFNALLWRRLYAYAERKLRFD
ncbi:MAG: ABC transporter permease [Hyphomicrobiaceae bacterium]